MNPSIIEIRGHHLLNLFCCFLGKDWERKTTQMIQGSWGEYGKSFSENAENILRKISDDPGVKIKLVVTIDDVCKNCSRVNDCDDEIWAGVNDQLIIEALGCKRNEIYFLNELLKKANDLIEAYEKGLLGEEPMLWLNMGKQRIDMGTLLASYKD